VGSEPLRELVAAFGGDAALFDGDLPDVLARLDAFSDRWDTRRGAERNLATSLNLTEGQEDLVFSAADALGLRSPAPPRRTSYDHVFALGGLVRACVMRPAYAAKLLQSGIITTPEVTALGGHRPFRGDEFALAAQAGLSDVTEEYEALDEGTRRAFGLGAPVESAGEQSDSVGGTWTVRTYEHPSGYRVRVAAAPSTEPDKRRANTPDTYQWFARTLARLQPEQRLLAVTTAIYVPAQHAAALRMLGLPFGVEIETVGVAPSTAGPLTQTFTASNYLQEIRSTIQSYRALFDAMLLAR
jgi:hypothetical protein